MAQGGHSALLTQLFPSFSIDFKNAHVSQACAPHGNRCRRRSGRQVVMQWRPLWVTGGPPPCWCGSPQPSCTSSPGSTAWAWAARCTISSRTPSCCTCSQVRMSGHSAPLHPRNKMLHSCPLRVTERITVIQANMIFQGAWCIPTFGILPS